MGTCLLAFCVLALASGPGLEATGDAGLDGVPRVLDVRSVDELRKVEPLAVDRYQVRLGMSEGGSDAVGWRLMHCLVSRGKPLETAEDARDPEGEQLGPVFVKVTRPGVMEAMRAASLEQQLIGEDESLLYAGVIETSEDGDYLVHVYAADGRLIAGRRFTVDVPHAMTTSAWAPFATPDPRDEDAHPVQLTRYSYEPSIPKLERTAPLARFDKAGRLLDFAGKPVKVEGLTATPEAGLNLPGTVPTPPAWAQAYRLIFKAEPARDADKVDKADGPMLRLGLEDGRFIVSCDMLMPNEPDEVLLARWSLNGKPWRAKMEDGTLMLARELAERTWSRRFSVAFGLPPHGEDLKPGDTVTVQVMMSPDGFERQRRGGLMELKELAQQEVGLSTGPLVSNRLDVKLTAALIETAKATAKATAEAEPFPSE